MSRDRVVVTGMGAVTGFGVGVGALWDGVTAGASAVGPITSFDVSGFPVRIASEIDSGGLPLDVVRPAKRLKLMSRGAVIAAVAAREAREAAGLGAGDVDPERLGVVFGAGGMGAVDIEFMEAQGRTLGRCEEDDGFDWGRFCVEYQRQVNPLAPIRALPNVVAANLAILHSARGHNLTVATACSSGTQAIGEASRILERGDADAVITGGVDAMINPTGILGFHLLGTLSTRNDDPPRASRPFDRDRDGFVLGEGGAVVVLEREAFARARGAPILARLAGYGATSDAWRMTDERPDGSGAAGVMERTIRDAGLTPADIGYVNAHGTGTPQNDRLETLAARRVFGGHPPPLSSTKSMIGHLLAGAGAVELVVSVLALSRGLLPPTINLETPDPECDLDYVPNRPREARLEAALSNSFGFGGQNASLAVTLQPT